MDVNFADPPIPPDWSVFEPRVTADRAPDALAKVAGEMRSSEILTTGFTDEMIEPAASALGQPEVADVYASGLPMVARFLTIELDTEHKEVVKGIGRLTKSPPRFGDKYRRTLKNEPAADEVRAVVEDLVLYGFAATAAVNACREEPAELRERELSQRWSYFVRNLHAAWSSLLDQFNMDENNPEPGILFWLGVAQPAMDNYVLLTERLGLGRRRPFGKARVASYAPFFSAVGMLVFFTGTDRDYV